MKLVQVINGEITQHSLPKTGTLKNGSIVSGYHLLDIDILKQEGWLPLEDSPPEHDEKTQYLVNDGYEILEDKVIKKYRIEEIPEREEPRDLEAEVEELRQIIEATQARVEFDTVVYDNAEFYSDDVSYVATIPENGLYYVQGTVAVMPMASGTVSIGAVNIESDTYVGGEVFNVEAQNVYTFKISTTAYFEKGDRIVIGVNNGTNGDLYTVSVEQASPILTLTRVGSL